MDTGTIDTNLVRQKIAEYAWPSLTGEPSYLTESGDGSLITVVDVSENGAKHQASISLAVRLLPGYVIVEHDINNKPLVDALIQAGVPRSKIILAYAGEPTPAAL